MRLIFNAIIFSSIVFSNLLNAQIPSFISEKSLSPKEKYSVQVWTTENGLPQNSINDITQTKDGYLWLATFDGLVKFDGIKFTNYNTSNTPELKVNGIKKLYCDNENRLWIIPADGTLVCHEQNKFKQYHVPAKLEIENYTITDFEDESILVKALNNKIYKLSNGKFELFNPVQLENMGSIATLNTNQLYIGTASGLYGFLNNELYEFPLLKNKQIISLIHSPSSEIIVLAENKIYSVHSDICKEIELPVDLAIIKDYRIGFNESKQLSVLTENGIYFISGDKATHLTTESGLSSNSIRSMFVDREKNLWIGTNNGGLNKLKVKLFKTYSKEDGLLDDGVTSIIESRNGTILIGNNCGGISEIKNEEFIKKIIQPKDKCVWSLMEDHDKNLWMGIYGGGIYVNSFDGIISHYTTNEGLRGNVIFSFFQDSQKNIWIGSSIGLSKFKDNEFISFDTSFHHSITYIQEDRNGDIWLCTDAGLAILKNGKIILKDEKSAFRKGPARYLYEDQEGVLWIGTHGNGLCRLKNGKTFYFNDYTKQLDKNVWSIVEDRSGNFWMPSNAGMYVVDKKELNDLADNNISFINPVYLSKEDGLKTIEFNGGFQSPVLKSSSGTFWFPTVKGAAMVDPDKLQKNNLNSQIIIEEIKSAEKFFAVSDRIHLKATDNNLLLRFTTPLFTNPSRICFQYKIEGIDNTWKEIGASRELLLSNIPDGEHILRLRVSGNPNSIETGLNLYKETVFWKNARFIIVASFVVVGLILLLTITVISAIRKREKIKTQLNKQYANIELKALQAQMNPHFIFNCLNSIQHFIIVNDEISASKYLTKFSMLMRKFLEHSKSNIVTLQEEVELLRLYVELEALRSKNKFNFHLKIATDIDIFNIEIPSMLFQPFVENAITHGLLNLDRKGTLILSFELEEGYLVGKIEDDGVGRVKAGEIQSETFKDHASRGMEIINDRIAVLNYIENIKIEVEVIDKINNNNEPAGTTVIIKIPI
jgi:ligand-binding sensor domain-containing protein